MQYIHNPFILTTLQKTLKQATFEPILDTTTKNIIILKSAGFACVHTPKKPFWQKGKSTLQALGVLALILPTKSLTQVTDTPNFEHLQSASTTLGEITSKKMLTVGLMPEHFFVNDEHRHGFGYEVSSRYADYLGTSLTLKTYASKESAIAALKAGEVDMVVGDQLDNGDVLTSSVGCKPSDFSVFGVNKTNFAVRTDSGALFDHTKSYLCDTKVLEGHKTLARFYQTNALDDYSVKHFHKALKERLPKYQATFKKQAKLYNQDWQLLAAISYQESHLNPNAISKTGVEGLMMLTKETAAEMGVDDRTNPVQSIQGGAKYLDKLGDYFLQVDESERLWFVLAAYNMGPNAVKNIQRKLKAQGQSPNSWADFYAYLSKNAKSNGRYVQCMHYVTNIRTYLETIKAKDQNA